MIGKVQLNNKPSFGAKFYSYPHCLTNPEIKEKFHFYAAAVGMAESGDGVY